MEGLNAWLGSPLPVANTSEAFNFWRQDSGALHRGQADLLCGW